MRVGSFCRRHRTALIVAAAVAWLGAFVLTHIPAERIPPLHTSDKWLHVSGYAGLTFMFWLVLYACDQRPWQRVLLSLPILAAYGGFDELTQPYFRRAASVTDWCFNCVGTLAAVTVLEVLCLWAGRKTDRRTTQPRQGDRSGVGRSDD